MLDASSVVRPATLAFGPPSIEQQLYSDSAASWYFPSQPLYQSRTAAFRHLQQVQNEHQKLSRSNFALTEDCPLKTVSQQQLHEPLDISQLTGVPLKQMTTVGRYGQGSRRAYGLMANIASGASSPLGAPGSAILGQGNNTQSGTAPNQQPKNPKLYKTELCRSWMDHGRCNYGERCQYAHGEQEKRPIPRHPKYKTAYCQSYHQTGYCPYGPRCHFIHNEESSTLNRNNASTLSSICVTSPNNPLLLTMNGNPGGTLHHPCGSAGESPVPSSAGSGSDSPLGSSSPSLDLDDNVSSFSANSWSNAFVDNTINTKKSHFEWPCTNLAGMEMITKTPLHITNSLCSPPTFDQSSLLVNDFLAWSFGDEPVSKTRAENTSGPVRLPVFAQFSNPTSSS